jgi:hypothetical protein
MIVLRCHWLNQNGVQCGQPLGHPCGHGNEALTTSHDTWHESLGERTFALTVSKKYEHEGTVWTDRSIKRRCIWHSVNGVCVYEEGHTLPHKDDTHNGN